MITVYYRLHANVARDLSTMLPMLVRPESWKSEQRMEAPGTIFVVSSVPELSGAADATKNAKETDPSLAPLLIERAVLIVQQTRAAHEEIAKVIARVESGDARSFGAAGGMGGGMGGFGGGFFSIGLESTLKPVE